MEREEIELLYAARDALQDYGFEYILEANGLELEDVLFLLLRYGDVELPNG